jgi:hypothetical protein
MTLAACVQSFSLLTQHKLQHFVAAEWNNAVITISKLWRKLSVIFSSCFQPSLGITIPDDPIIGCECPDACDIKSGDSCCPGNNGQYFPYTKFGKLRVGIGKSVEPGLFVSQWKIL